MTANQSPPPVRTGLQRIRDAACARSADGSIAPRSSAPTSCGSRPGRTAVSAERKINAVVAGITVPVTKTDGARDSDVFGIGSSAVIDHDGQLRFALTTVHQDGSALTAWLCEESIDRLANMMADFLEALPAIRSEVRH